MKRRLPIWLTVLCTIWIAFVVVFYFANIKKIPISDYKANKVTIAFEVRESHSYYIDSVKKAFTFTNNDEVRVHPVAISLFLILVVAGSASFVLKRRRLNVIKISPINLIVVAFGFTVMLFVLWSWYYGAISFPSLGKSVQKIGINFLEILLLGLPTIALGKKIMGRFLKGSDDKFYDFIFSIGLGIGALIPVLFVLASCGIMTTLYLVVLLASIIIFCYREVFNWIKVLIFNKVELPRSFLSMVLVFLAIILFSQNILDTIRPMPIGHDDLEQYMNITSLIVKDGHLPNISALPYPWELFRAAPWILFGNAVATNVLSSLAGFLAFLALFKLGLTYLRHKKINNLFFLPLSAAVLFYVLPMVAFQSAVDLKVDLFAFFLGALSLILLLDWSRQQSPRNYLLYLAFYFAGLAFAVKVTSIFFAIVLIIMAIVILQKKKLQINKSIRVLALSLLLFMIGVAPFGVRNIIQNKSLNINQIMTSHSTGIGLELNQESLESKLIDSEVDKNNQKELNRYFGFRKTWLANLITLPFTQTNNSAISGQYVDISFVYLALLPLIILFFFKRRLEQGNPLRFVLTGTILFWILWALSSRGIIWYGILGFSFLSIILFEVLANLRKISKTLFYISSLIIGMSILCCFFFRMVSPAYLIDERQVEYMGGSKSEEEFVNSVFPVRLDLELLNERIAQAKNPDQNKVYVIGKYCKYFIDHNDDLVLQDQFITFGKLFLPRKNVDAVIKKFKEEGIKYIVVSDVSGIIFDSTILAEVNGLGYDFVVNNPERIKVLNEDSASGVVIAEIL